MSAHATSVGLDVHARSVVGCGLDGRTGELFERRLSPDHGDIASWIRSLPGPVVVTYEAGPTGFGLARHLTGDEVISVSGVTDLNLGHTPREVTVTARRQDGTGRDRGRRPSTASRRGASHHS